MKFCQGKALRIGGALRLSGLQGRGTTRSTIRPPKATSPVQVQARPTNASADAARPTEIRLMRLRVPIDMPSDGPTTLISQCYIRGSFDGPPVRVRWPEHGWQTVRMPRSLARGKTTIIETVLPCPKCRTPAKVRDGIYDFGEYVRKELSQVKLGSRLIDLEPEHHGSRERDC